MEYISSDTNINIDTKEFKYCIEELLKNNGKKVRLPEGELQRRLE